MSIKRTFRLPDDTIVVCHAVITQDELKRNPIATRRLLCQEKGTQMALSLEEHLEQRGLLNEGQP